MTLAELLKQTRDASLPYGDGGMQVFGNDPRYFRLRDYAVSSAVSGPSLILIPR